MAKHRALYGWDKPKGPAKPKKDMPFKASRRHEYWSIDVRYIEHHQLPNVKGPVYVMSVLENFSRMLLASILSEKQDTAAYLRVLALALRNYGAPEAIVTDGGGIINLSSHLLRNALYPPSGSIRIHPFPQVGLLCGSRACQAISDSLHLHAHAQD